MSSVQEIGGRGAGTMMSERPLLAPGMAGWGESGAAYDGPKLKVRAEIEIPDAWDDSDDDKDDDAATTETERSTVKGSTNSLVGMADNAWNSDDDA